MNPLDDSITTPRSLALPLGAIRNPQSAMEKTNHGWTRMDTDGKHFSLSAFISVHPRFKSAIRNPQSAIRNRVKARQSLAPPALEKLYS